MNKLESLCKEKAMTIVFAETSCPGGWLEAYDILCKCASEDSPLPECLTVWEQHEGTDAPSLRDLVESEAFAAERFADDLLEKVKAGIADAAVHGELPLDLGQLDMREIFERGCLSQEATYFNAEIGEDILPGK